MVDRIETILETKVREHHYITRQWNGSVDRFFEAKDLGKTGDDRFALIWIEGAGYSGHRIHRLTPAQNWKIGQEIVITQITTIAGDKESVCYEAAPKI